MDTGFSEPTPSAPAPAYDHLVSAIGKLVAGARRRAVQAVNTEMVGLYWEIGRHIIE